jgi:hypothetical protein
MRQGEVGKAQKVDGGVKRLRQTRVDTRREVYGGTYADHSGSSFGAQQDGPRLS